MERREYITTNNLDRRTRRTRRLIGRALIDLICERRYDRITVQDIIDRADVGRSTFYAHYRDKEDVLVSESERMLALLSAELSPDDAGREPLIPCLGLFRHVEEMHREYEALFQGRFLQVFYETAHRYLSRSVETRLEARGPDDREAEVPVTILADYVAGAFLHLMRWWLDHGRPYPPERMDGIFQLLVLPGVHATLSAQPSDR